MTPVNLLKTYIFIYGKILIIRRGSEIRCLYLNPVSTVVFLRSQRRLGFSNRLRLTVQCFLSKRLVAITGNSPHGTSETKTHNHGEILCMDFGFFGVGKSLPVSRCLNGCQSAWQQSQLWETVGLCLPPSTLSTEHLHPSLPTEMMPAATLDILSSPVCVGVWEACEKAGHTLTSRVH